MHEAQELPRPTRSFIVLVALLQGGLLYLAQKGTTEGWWPFAALSGRICWYTLVLAVPTAMILSVVELRDKSFWRHAALLAALFAALAIWAVWNATGAPGIRSWKVLAPFGISLGIGLFIALPWWQGRLARGTWRQPYAALFEHAWQNALTLLLAALFTGICWAVLWLWAALFELVKIDFFRELFREDAFVHLATGAMAGFGILIGRTQQRPVQVARQILFAVLKGLLPLLAFIALLFAASLPFTGLQPLWHTDSAAVTLVSLIALLVIFVNAVFQEGTGPRPYPTWLRRVVEVAVLVLPLYAALALLAMGLRIGQYGWTPDRFWAGLLVLIAALHAFGYAWVVLRSRGDAHWLQRLPRVNCTLAWVAIALAVLANSPLLDPYRVTVSSQIARVSASAPTLAQDDLDQLRFDSGRRGYEALRALRANPALRDHADALAAVDRTLARMQRWGDFATARERERDLLRDEAQLRRQIAVAPGTGDIDATWWQAVLGERLKSGDCRLRGADCVVMQRDLDSDGRNEVLLCAIHAGRLAVCQVHVLHKGQWHDVGQASFYAVDKDKTWPAQEAALRQGRIALRPRRWPDLAIGDSEPQAIEPAAAASVTYEDSP